MISTKGPTDLTELAAAIRSAVGDVLGRLDPCGLGAVRFHGELTGQLEHDGHPETAIGFTVRLGDERPTKKE